MKKKILFLVAAFALFVPSVLAAELTAGTDEELINAFATAASGDTIKLTANIENHKGNSNALMVKDGKVITLDLNGHSISTDPAWNNDTNKPVHRSITVNGGTLNVIGKGTIINEKHVAINVWGTENPISTAYSTLNVGKDVTLEGNTGVSVFEDNEHGYGVVVNFEGKVNATEIGLTINGNIQHEDGPVFNVKNGSEINVNGPKAVGIYAAGNGTWNIEKGITVTSDGSAIGVKAGTLNIKGGDFTSTGEFKANPEAKTGTIVPAGVAIQLETNSSYYGHIKLNISDGTFTSKNGNVILEYGSDTTTAVENVSIVNGEFNSADGKAIIATSEPLKTAQANNVIKVEGGLFSNKVENEYLGTDKITITIAAAITENGETVTENIYTVVGSKGNVLDEDAVAELEDLLGDIGEGYKLVGYYSDSELKNKFDFSKEMNDNTTIYMSFVKDAAPVKEENPKTSDMNLALILTSLGLASVGAVLVSRKKLAKANR